MTTPHVPPGRMGKLWLLSRLALAERGVSLLEEKLRLLGQRRDELHRRAENARRDWYFACREADSWGLRAALSGGQRAISLAVPREQASITIEWAATAGVRYPDRAECTLPPHDSPTEIHISAATVGASRAHRAAVVAAAQCAAAESALATIEREFRATQLRARALSKHWLPRLHDDLARIEMQLEEQDRAEAIRLRLVKLGGGTA
jgi:V/A-type H+/Na+-transporting ATPase subunit D